MKMLKWWQECPPKYRLAFGAIAIIIPLLLGTIVWQTIEKNALIAAANKNSKFLNAGFKTLEVPKAVSNKLQVWYAKGCAPGKHLYGEVSADGVQWYKLTIEQDCHVGRHQGAYTEKEFSGVVMLLE